MAKRSSSTLTKAHVDGAIQGVNEGIRHLYQSQAQGFKKVDGHLIRIDDRLDGMDIKLDAIMEAVATRKEMQNLVRQLKAQGIALDESKIFVS